MLPKFAALSATLALVGSVGLLSTTPAGAATPQPADTQSAGATSTVGGARLGQSDEQVQRGSGAPVLPSHLTALSWLVADAETGDVLAAKAAHRELPPASTLKMLFADTVLPKFPKDLQYKVETKDLEGMGDGSSLVGVQDGLTYTVHDLWLGVFLRSGNDAVHALAGLNGGVDNTVQEMRDVAAELQANDTHVVTPDGYDEDGQVSSAYDLTLFAREGLQNAQFREYCSTLTAKFPGAKTKSGKRSAFQIQNTNRLLGKYQGLAGVKNGYTTKAGHTFTGVAQRGQRTLLVTVMNPEPGPDRVYTEAAALLDWGFQAADKVQPVGILVPPKSKVSSSRSAASASEGVAGQGPHAALASSSGAGSSGLWTALAITAGAIALLGAVAFAVRRRWPLPQLISGKANAKVAATKIPNPAEAAAEAAGDAEPAETGQAIETAKVAAEPAEPAEAEPAGGER